MARRLKVPPFIKTAVISYLGIRRLQTCKKRWLVNTNDGEPYFDINGAKLPDVTNISGYKTSLAYVLEDTFHVPYFYNDNHDRAIVEQVDKFMIEGPYGYTDGRFDVTVKKGDAVIDAGAWIGDFSAYAANKGATVYAFEPVKSTYQLLCKTQMLNNIKGGGIYPVRKGLSSMEQNVDITINTKISGANSTVITDSSHKSSEKITLTTIDRFAKENNLERVDFIKADIEGAERDMLRGATNVLRTFAPKLAICTYHLPDDPQVLEQIIKQANPKYRVIHTRHKLFASTVY
ncbi:MAG: FkbM family methyltransferase [Dysgonamonadaceae bacterium]|nr:FkbM family methyltransferase [Dysgonamonadaceae bacterium]